MKNYKKESDFQRDLKDEIEELFPGSLVLKNDPGFIQGIPDLTVLYGNQWAILECKKSGKEPYRPNQERYLERTNDMSFSRTIYPENKEAVLNELQEAFRVGREARLPRSK